MNQGHEETYRGLRPSMTVIQMVSELHQLGYQKARIMPYEYPIAYRILIAPAEIFSSRNGAYFHGGGDDCAAYSSAMEYEFFGWRDATSDSARTLAEKFVERFPSLADHCRGRDPAYADWLAELLAILARNPGRLPVVMWDHMACGPEELRVLPLRLYAKAARGSAGDMTFDLPPLPPPE
jgi:hypothetical protein